MKRAPRWGGVAFAAMILAAAIGIFIYLTTTA
jgi:hypothetical protein